MYRKFLPLFFLFFLIPTLAANRCSCDVVQPYGEPIGICLDSTWTNNIGEEIHHCCRSSLSYAVPDLFGTTIVDLSAYGFVLCNAAVRTSSAKSAAGTPLFYASSVSMGTQLGGCSSRNRKYCEINPDNGYGGSGASDVGRCDNDSDNCVVCNDDNIEIGRWNGNTYFSASGDKKCEHACGANDKCDERKPGSFEDPDGDNTVDRCSSDCETYTDSDTCEADYGASSNCDGKEIGYYDSVSSGGCTNKCRWDSCGNFAWDALTNTCYDSCDSEDECLSPAICTPSNTCVIDNNPPSVTITAPVQDAIYSSSPVTLRYNVTDDIDPQLECLYVLDTSNVSTGTITSGSEDVVYIPMGEGVHSIYVNCTDQANNVGQSYNTIQFTVDFGDPSYSGLGRTPSGQIYHSDDVILYCNWTDASGIGIVYARHNATGSWENYTTQKSGDTYSYTIPNSLVDDQESIAWNFWARDAVGNWADNMTQQYFTVDNRIPSVPVIDPEPDTHSLTVLLNWIASSDDDNDSITYDVRAGIATEDDFFNSTESSNSTILNGLSYYTMYGWSVRACDPYECSLWMYDNFTVTNALPTITTVQITSAAFTTTTLFCTPNNVTDADNDQVSLTYNWYNNSQLTDIHTDYMEPINFSEGDEIFCGVVPYDGISDGIQVNSTPVTIANSPPTPPQGASPSSTHFLSQTMTFVKGTDADGETVTTYICVDNSTWTTSCNGFTDNTLGQSFDVTGLSYGGASKAFYVRMWSQGSVENLDVYLNVTNTQPTAPTDLGIQDSHDLTPTLNWTIGSDPDGDTVANYICVDSQDTYDDCDASGGANQTATGTYTVASPLTYGNTYYVRTFTRDNTGASNQDSDYHDWSFTLTNADPSVGIGVFDPATFEYNVNVNCSALVNDPDGDSLTVTYEIYDSGAGGDYSGTANCAAGTCTVTIPNIKGPKGSFTCRFYADDGYVVAPINGTLGYANLINSEPTAPGNIDPDKTHNPQPTITWEASTDPNPEDTVVYYINITDADTGAEVLAITRVSTNEYTIPSPLDFPDFYNIYVWASDDVENSTVTMQTVDYSNFQPNVTLSPVDDTHALSATLQWSGNDPDEDDLTYNLQVSTDYTFASVDVYETYNNATTQHVQLLDWDTDYYWRVKACDNTTALNNCTTWSAADDFSVINQPPYVPYVTDELDQHTADKTLNWNNSISDPDSDDFTFEVWVGTQPNDHSVYSQSDIASTESSLDLVGILTDWDTDYYWSVRACDNTTAINTCSNWGGWDNFTRVNEAPSLPQHQSPDNAGTPHSLSVTLTWLNGVDPDGDGTTTYLSLDYGAANSSATSPFIYSVPSWNVEHFWSLRTCDDTGATDDCSQWVNWTFTPTNTAPVIISADATPVTNVGDDVTFSVTWGDAHADPATIYVCNDGACTSCHNSGTNCWCRETTPTGNNPIICTYTAQQSDSSKEVFDVMVCDEFDECTTDSSSDRTFDINHIPTYTSMADDSPVNIGEDVTFTVTDPADSDGDTWYLYICKDASCANCEPSDTSNCWATGASNSSTAVYTTQVGDNVMDWYGVIYDEHNFASTITSVDTFDADCNEHADCAAGYYCDASGICQLKKTATDCTSSCDASTTITGAADNTVCASGICFTDYDTVGSWCAGANVCCHDATDYGESESAPDCSSGTQERICSSGVWAASACVASNRQCDPGSESIECGWQSKANTCSSGSCADWGSCNNCGNYESNAAGTACESTASYCSKSCGATVATTADCPATLNDGTDTCTYDQTVTDACTCSGSPTQTCPDYCIDDSDGQSCDTSHTAGIDEICYYNDACYNTDACEFGSSASLRADYCDTCGAAGVTAGAACAPSECSSACPNSGNCYYDASIGDRSDDCTGTTCKLNSVAMDLGFVCNSTGAACNEVECYSDCQDTGHTSGTCIDASTCTCYDTPQLLEPLPTGVTDTSVQLSVQTDVDANCKFDTTNDFDYSTEGISFDNGQGAKNHTHNLSDLADGAHTYYYKCENGNGDVSSQATASFTVDDTAPVYSNGDRTPNPIYNDMNVEVNITWTDASSDVEEVIFSHDAEGSWKNFTASKKSGTDTYYYIIQSQYLENQETVQYDWYAQDTFDNWNSNGTYSFQVSNRAPFVGESIVEFVTAEPYRDSVLTCENYSSGDPDIDGFTLAYKWYNSSIEISGQTQKTLPASTVYRDDVITCGITPTDDWSEQGGETVSSGITIANKAPSAPSVYANNTFDKTPSITWNSSTDIDGDSLIYWIKVGTESGGSDTLGWTSTNETFYNFENPISPNSYYVTVKATDDEDLSAPGTADLTITNNETSAPSIILPANGTNIGSAPRWIVMNWTSGTDLDPEDVLYNYWEISDQQDFSSILNSSYGLASAFTEVQHYADTSDTTYYWRVLTTDTYSNSTWEEGNFYTPV